jgi:hypothetical protein
MLRAAAAGISFVLAAASGVVTALVTAHSSRGLWVALGVLVVVGGVLQAALTVNERRSPGRVAASGAGAVAVGGSASKISTRVTGSHGPAVTPDGDGVTASGPGAIGVGGDVTGPLSTDVTDADGQGPP